ncbi:hypothetical protein N431DRAFT_501399 [Stipitochalara longipes BDJ]|nr:hypothetical protein N431DRAFT_501399 [Stipitochalara longipes BDJ]
MAEANFPSAEDQSLPPPPLWIWPTMMTAHRSYIPSLFSPISKTPLICGATLLKLFITTLWGYRANVLAYSHAIQSFMLLCHWIDFTVVHDPERDFWTVDQSAAETRRRVAPRNIKVLSCTLAKLKWWAGFLLNSKGVALNIQCRDLPSPIRDLPFTISSTYLLTDLVTTLLVKLSTDVPFFDTPSDWPLTFGSFSENCYTIGGLWGRFYHQWVRRKLSTAEMLVNKLIGFGFSTLIHTFGAIAGSYEDSGFWQAMFFLVQPVGILVEESAKSGIDFIWVTLWDVWIRDDRPPSIVDFIFGLIKQQL